jgi:hypothetical protein
MTQSVFSRFNPRLLLSGQRFVEVALFAVACALAPLAQPTLAQSDRPSPSQTVAVGSPATPARATNLGYRLPDRCQQADRRLQRLYSFQDGDRTITICQKGQQYVYVQTRDRD